MSVPRNPTKGFLIMGTPPVTQPVQLFVEGQRLRIQLETGEVMVEWPAPEIRVGRGGFNDRHLLLGHAASPGVCAYTEDPHFVAALAQAGCQHAVAEHDSGRQRRVRRLVPWLAAILLVVGVIGGLVLLVVTQKNRWVRYLADQIPLAWEQQFGDSLAKQFQTGDKWVRDSPHGELVEAAIARLKKASPGAARYEFRYYIVRDPTVNAFALPGGHMVIHTALLETAAAGELAGVLAHEMAHVTERHGFRKIIESAGLWLTIQMLLGDASGLTAIIARSSELLLRQKYSRDFEREADDVGWDTLVAARIDPRGMTGFFEKLKDEQEKAAGAPVTQALAWLNTHPTTDERIRRLEKKWKDLERRGDVTFTPVTPQVPR